MPHLRPVRLLASVTDEKEAALAVALGADLVDAKNPSAGALGALPLGVIRSIVATVAGRRIVSATIGDHPAVPDYIAREVEAIAATGVDFVKVGIYPDGDQRAVIARIGELDLGSCRAVAVLLADRRADFSVIPDLARAGFAGVMLDTADKANGALTDVLATPLLKAFVATVRRERMFAGLAGALRQHHIAELLALAPDILGFRGALCAGANRIATLDHTAFRAVRNSIPADVRAGLDLVGRTEARAS